MRTPLARERIARTVGALALVSGSLTAAVSPQAAASPARPSPAVIRTLGLLVGPPGDAASRGGTVTLVTGDTVTVTVKAAGGEPSASVVPGPGREGVRFTVINDDEGVAVIPDDAVAPVAAGRVDARLFNVSQLIAWGYDDAGTDSIALLTKRAGTAAGKAATVPGARLVRSFDRAAVDAQLVPKSQAAAMWKDLVATRNPAAPLGGGAIDKVWVDGKSALRNDVRNSRVGADQAWASGYDGTGVKVAVLDSGYDASHPDLQGVVVAERDFTGSPDGMNDTTGHGTHVSSVIAGTGAASGGRYKGVAPGAKLVEAKVCADWQCPDSAVLAAIDWAVLEQRARVVNLSFSRPVAEGGDPLVDAVNLYAFLSGAVFTAPSGDMFWPRPADTPPPPVEAPGTAAAALTVGATAEVDAVAWYSATGPGDDGGAKPDIVAPATGIVAARATGTQLGEPVGDSYTRANGTSMATAAASGAAAILAQRHPAWHGMLVKGALIQSARPLTAPAGPFEQGAGMLDIPAALAQQVIGSAVPVTVNVAPGGRTTTAVPLFNPGDVRARLDLSATAFDERGRPAPGTLVTLNRASVNIPARGAGAAVVNVTSAGTEPGTYYAVVTGRDGNGEVRTKAVVAVRVEPSTHVPVVRVVDSAGQPYNGDISVNLTSKTTGYRVTANRAPDGSLQCVQRGADYPAPCRLPEGDYLAHSAYFEPNPFNPVKVHVFLLPVSVGPAGLTLTLDARGTVPAGVTVDTPGATPVSRTIAYRTPDYPTLLSQTPYPYALHVLPVDVPGMTYLNHSVWTDGTPTSAYRYDVLDTHEGGVPRTPGVAAAKNSMAQVQRTYKAQGTAATGLYGHEPEYKGTPLGLLGYAPAELPLQTDHYLTTSADIRWNSELHVGDHLLRTAFASYAIGPNGRHPVGSVVFGPTLPAPLAVRQGDVITVSPQAHLDGRYGPPTTIWDKQPVSLLGDGRLGGAGLDVSAAQSTTLSRSGTVLVEKQYPYGFELGSPSAVVGPERATYELRAAVTRNSAVSTKVDVVWTFASAHLPRTASESLPLIDARLGCDPEAGDAFNRVPAGTRMTCTVTAGYQPGVPAPFPGVAQARAEYSLDDGQTWRTVTGFTATDLTLAVDNPDPGFVSLRVSLTDATGGTVTTTVIRAYEVGAA